MIVDRRTSPSSIFRYAWRGLVLYTAYCLLVGVLCLFYDVHWLEIPFAAVGTLGTAVAIFLAFRNSSAYDRWWEARKLWGALVNHSRTFARQVLTCMSSEQPEDFGQELIYRQIAFANALRLHLRRQSDWNELAPFLSDEEMAKVAEVDNVPNWLLQRQAERLWWAVAQGWLDRLRHLRLDETLRDFTDVLGACERIKNTPLPRHYDFFTELFVWFYCLCLPLGLASDVGWWAVPLSVGIGYVFATLNVIGERNEDPFENRHTDTPMTALSQTIEISLREQLGETQLPQPLRPVRGILY